jgi:hypothetical protein
MARHGQPVVSTSNAKYSEDVPEGSEYANRSLD